MRRLWLTMLVLVLGYGAPALSAAEASLTHGMVIDVEEGQRVSSSRHARDDAKSPLWQEPRSTITTASF
jgi:hypothetical protein